MTTSTVTYEDFLNLYNELRKTRLTAGIDKISKIKFEKDIKNNLDYIIKGLINGSYKFNPFKEQLIIKKSDKPPRILSLPTIKDKLVLKYIKKYLDEKLEVSNSSNIMKILCSSIKEDIKKEKYNYFITLDIKDYYTNVNQDLLIGMIREKVDDENVVDLITKAIKNPTVPEGTSKSDRNKYSERVCEKGVPQGVSISNGLANFYLSEFDKRNSKATSYRVYRYVDDMLIFCNDRNFKRVKQIILSRLKEYKLEQNPDKFKHGSITPNLGVDFLGYTFYENGDVSVSKQNKIKFMNSIEKIFNDYANAKNPSVKLNTELLRWKLDNKIAGIFINRRQYGWLYYFSQSNDKRFCFSLDLYIIKLLKRYKANSLLNDTGTYQGRKFVSAFHFIECNKTISPYTRHCDKMQRQEKKRILETVAKYNFKEGQYTEASIDYLFDRFLFKSIRDLEYDLANRYL